jgi:hypothetical protein
MTPNGLIKTHILTHNSEEDKKEEPSEIKQNNEIMIINDGKDGNENLKRIETNEEIYDYQSIPEEDIIEG